MKDNVEESASMGVPSSAAVEADPDEVAERGIGGGGFSRGAREAGAQEPEQPSASTPSFLCFHIICKVLRLHDDTILCRNHP